MEKYDLHMCRDVAKRVKDCALTHITNGTWFTVEELGDIMEVDLSDTFGKGNLGWSPKTLLHRCWITETTVDAVLSVPKPEVIPSHHIGCTVRDRMEHLAGHERPTLKDWLNNSGIHSHAPIGTGRAKYGNGRHDCVDSISYAHMIMLDHPELVAGSEMIIRKLMEFKKDVPFVKEFLNGLYGVNSLQGIESIGEHCCDAVSESAEDVRKSTRLDGTDAFTYDIRALFERKDGPGFKNALDGIYGTAPDVASIDFEQMYPKKLGNVEAAVTENVNVASHDIFVTINSDHVSPQVMHEIAKLIAVLSDTDRDIHVNII